MNIREIRNEIEKLEHSETTYQVCEKLAVLYQVADHFDKKEEPEMYSYATSNFASTEFGMAFENAPYDHALSVIEEHMEVIKLTYPKEYNMIMKKLKNE